MKTIKVLAAPKGKENIHYNKILIFEPRHDKTKKWVCAQRRLRLARASAHLPSLIRVFAVRMKKAYVLANHWAQRRLWSDWADTQADLSLRWAHSHFVGFVMSRLIYIFIAIAIDETGILAAVYFAMQNIYQSCDLIREVRRSNVDASQ